MNSENSKKIFELLDKEQIKTSNELKKVFDIYKIYLKYNISSTKIFEALLKNSCNNGKFLNWSHKIDFIREKRNISKDQFAIDLQLKLEDYLKRTNDSFDISFRNKKIPKSEFDKAYGYKTASTIRQFLKDTPLDNSKNFSREIKEQYRRESKFIENFCNIFNISYNWFVNKMYKTIDELNSTPNNEMNTIINPFSISLENKENDEIINIINNSDDTINIKIKTLLESIKKDSNKYSKEFYIVLLLNSFERNSVNYSLLNNTLLELIDFIESINIDFKYAEQLILTKAKLLSNEKQDKNVIELLLDNFHFETEKDIEKINLLAGTYKRLGFNNNSNETEELEESLNLYKKSYKISENYYSLINILYILIILDYNKEFNEYAVNWDNIPVKNDWWYMISKLEFLMLKNDKENLLKELNNIPDIKTIKKFDITATLRQLNIYKDISKKETESLIILINKLEEIEKNPDLGRDSYI